MSTITFHILIVTIGRSTLQKMVDSLLPQLLEGDHLTILFDGIPVQNLNISEGCCSIHMEEVHETQRHYAQHSIRTKASAFLHQTDFIMHADDDDIYADDAFTILRKLCRDKDTLYVAKMISKLHNDEIIPRKPEISLGNIGTPCGIIPYYLNSMAPWTNSVGGDGDFYISIARHASRIEFLDHIIYIVRPSLLPNELNI
jgi:hypothetical protein